MIWMIRELPLSIRPGIAEILTPFASVVYMPLQIAPGRGSQNFRQIFLQEAPETKGEHFIWHEF
jgi:hypothetical protein